MEDERARPEQPVDGPTGLLATLALVALLGGGAAVTRFAQVHAEAARPVEVLWQTPQQLDLERARQAREALSLAKASAAIFALPAVAAAGLLVVLRRRWSGRSPRQGA